MTHHIVVTDSGTQMWHCSALATFERQQLEDIEARHPQPSLHDCGNHFVDAPEYPPED